MAAPQGPPLSPAMAEHRRLVVWWLTSAAILLVILVAAAGYFVVSTVGPLVQSHRSGCLPADFPIYPHMAIAEVDVSYDALPNGDSSRCRMRMGSRDSYDSVNAFYRFQLNNGDWMYSGYFESTGGSSITFGRRSRANAKGEMTIHKQVGGGTPFEVELVS